MEAAPTSTALTTMSASVVIATGASPSLVPWRDPHTVPPEDLATYIQKLERACLVEPRSADLRTCLGMAYAMNYEVDKSMDSLEEAVTLDPDSFWARLKFAELHYRLRVLNKAEEETLKALSLASDRWQLSIARKQLQDIRVLKQGCVRNVEWTKPLTVPALVLSLMLLLIFVSMTWR
jgi:tetratricopeptide (TPR) repeat protein